jgi:fucose permease
VNARRWTAAACAAGFVAGAATTMLSPLLPALAARWRIGDASAGLLFGALYGASLCVAATVGWLGRRSGYLALLAPGLALVGLGAAALPAAGWPAGLAAVACCGAGIGLIVPAGNLWLAARHPGASARPVALLNLVWCAGAVLAPLAVAFAPAAFLPALAGTAIVLAALLSIAPRRPEQPAARERAEAGRGAGLLTAASVFLYVGAESSVSGWMPTQALRDFGGNPLWSALPSVFWAGMLAGRAVTPRLVRRIHPAVLLSTGLCGALAAVLLLLAAPGPGWLAAGGALGGLAMAPVFPLLVAQYAETSGGGRTSGLIFSMGGLGGAAVPPLVGIVAARTGDLRYGMALVACELGVALCLQPSLRRRAAQAARKPSQTAAWK